jgi:DNA-binding MarR family transcriptional regulator
MNKTKLVVIIILFFALNFSIKTLGNTSKSTNNQSDGLYITYPNGGETLSGNVTVTWRLAQVYLPYVNSYELLCSPNNGQNWIQVGVSFTDTSYLWITSIYEDYGTDYLIKVVASSKEWPDKEAISDGTFTIDNRVIDPSGKNAGEIAVIGLISSMLVISVMGFGYYNIRKNRLTSFSNIFQVDKHSFLKEISHKLIIGVDNIKSGFIDEPLDLPLLDTTVITPSSMLEYFPSDFQRELRSDIKGRTILTLIEIAYQDPSDTNPAKIANSLNIPRSTLSKEIKKLVELDYLQTHVSEQVVMDARYRNFKITSKGFYFLSVLNTAIKATITRVKTNVLFE